MPAAIDHVLFDLDGTLVDTAPDLADALNQVRLEQAHPALPMPSIRPFVSLGTNAMLGAAFGIGKEHADFAAIRARFLNAYREHVAEKSRLFPGMDRVLKALADNAIPWGIVTNKPGQLTAPLARALKLDRMTKCIVSGDTAEYAKPHPAPMRYACALLGCRPGQVLYIGDARRDIEAGKNAGMKTLAAGYGYIPLDDAPGTWGADGVINSPLEILDWLPGIRP